MPQITKIVFCLPQTQILRSCSPASFQKLSFGRLPEASKIVFLEAQTLSFWLSWAVSKIGFLEGAMFAKIAILSLFLAPILDLFWAPGPIPGWRKNKRFPVKQPHQDPKSMPGLHWRSRKCQIWRSAHCAVQCCFLKRPHCR